MCPRWRGRRLQRDGSLWIFYWRLSWAHRRPSSPSAALSQSWQRRWCADPCFWASPPLSVCAAQVWSLGSQGPLYTFPNEHARQSLFRNLGTGVMQIEVGPADHIFSCGADGTMKMRILPNRFSVAHSNDEENLKNNVKFYIWKPGTGDGIQSDHVKDYFWVTPEGGGYDQNQDRR